MRNSCGMPENLETFQIRSLKDLQREALEKLVGGQDVYLIQPIGTQNRAAEIEPKPNCETFELCWLSHSLSKQTLRPI